MAHLSNLFSTFTKKTTDLSLHSRVFALHNVSTSLSSHSGQRDISLREVAADSFREEAQPAFDAVACLPNQLLSQGISMIYYSIPEVANKDELSPFKLVRGLLATGEVDGWQYWQDFTRASEGMNRVRFSKGLLALAQPPRGEGRR